MNSTSCYDPPSQQQSATSIISIAGLSRSIPLVFFRKRVDIDYLLFWLQAQDESEILVSNNHLDRQNSG
jgi:hypothetical protein